MSREDCCWPSPQELPNHLLKGYDYFFSILEKQIGDGSQTLLIKGVLRQVPTVFQHKVSSALSPVNPSHKEWGFL